MDGTLLLERLTHAAIALAVLAAVYIPLEKAFTARRQGILRAEWGTDLVFFLGQYLLWLGAVTGCLIAVHHGLSGLRLGGIRETVAGWPWWVQVLCVLLLGDLLVYWGHRAAHSIPFLWRFHRVHHTSPHLDWMAAHREHPFDGLYTQLWQNLPAIVLGFPLATIAGLAVFRGLWGIFIHSNVDIPLGPLRYVVGSPRLHHWHHEIASGHTCNFANLCPLMDLIFGTYKHPDREPEAYGVPDPLPHGYLHQMVEPFRKR